MLQSLFRETFPLDSAFILIHIVYNFLVITFSSSIFRKIIAALPAEPAS
ncbi:hypothetical protein CLOLEP_00890 [[Clostridium] leptum DSM 753]|uniref:Uncharacterized protein n=1 Tax=[Clostridium] leptum DSM 753 TaxID=428125 RepID=A7VQQ8_9FIRM|nr:hypothetical protein CLOLEP_00890 [[Clostridium] leptum DSM 753]